jgi:peroxiredoxin
MGVSLALVLLLAGGASRAESGGSAPKSTRDRVGLGSGYRPPPFSATDMAGQSHSLEQYAGSVLVLHFWASWCPYCRSEIPELTELQQQWADKGVRILTVSTDHEPEALKRFIAQTKLPYPIVADAQAEWPISEQYGVSGIPVTYIIGPDGVIVERFAGATEIIEAVKRVLARSSKT